MRDKIKWCYRHKILIPVEHYGILQMYMETLCKKIDTILLKAIGEKISSP